MILEFKEDLDYGEFDLMATASAKLVGGGHVAASESPAKGDQSQAFLMPEFHHIPRLPRKLPCQPSYLPKFLYGLPPKVQCNGRKL